MNKMKRVQNERLYISISAYSTGRPQHADRQRYYGTDEAYKSKIPIRQPGIFRRRHDLSIHDGEYLDNASGELRGGIFTLAAFFGGILLMWFLEAVIAPHGHDHGCGFHGSSHGQSIHDPSKLMRIGQLTAIALAIHNFPEGLTTFVSALQGMKIAIPVVVAIIIHNIPAGISISSPIYHATGSRMKAIKYSFLSGLAEPAGALAGWLILVPFMSDLVFGFLYAGVAGVMIFMSFDELLPSAREYGNHKFSIYGLVLGMAVMAVSLLML